MSLFSLSIFLLFTFSSVFLFSHGPIIGPPSRTCTTYSRSYDRLSWNRQLGSPISSCVHPLLGLQKAGKVDAEYLEAPEAWVMKEPATFLSKAHGQLP